MCIYNVNCFKASEHFTSLNVRPTQGEYIMATKTIAETTKRLICEVDENGIGLSINNILELIHDEHPGCKTSKACVSWYISKAKTGDLTNFEGELPRERTRSSGKANVTLPQVKEETTAEAWLRLTNAVLESEHTDDKLRRAVNAAMKRVDIMAVIAAENATEEETNDASETMTEEAIPMTEEFDESEAIPMTEEELAALVG